MVSHKPDTKTGAAPTTKQVPLLGLLRGKQRANKKGEPPGVGSSLLLLPHKFGNLRPPLWADDPQEVGQGPGFVLCAVFEKPL